MNENLFKVLMALIPVLGVIVTGFVVPYIKTKISLVKLDEISRWIKVAVQAADMLYVGNKMGKDKKKYVLELILDFLNNRNIKISEEQLDALIESAVNELKINQALINL